MGKGVIGYERSQEVAGAFIRNGHDFKSCDILDSYGEYPEAHVKGDIRKYLLHEIDASKLDFIGLHPVCQYLANSGVRWLYNPDKTINADRWHKMVLAATEFKRWIKLFELWGMKGYIENPIMHKHAMNIIGGGHKPSQIIQPWQFGHTTSKATCLWIFGLPNLKPTEVIPKELRTYEIHKCAPGPDRERIRSKTFPNIAKAMADQWG